MGTHQNICVFLPSGKTFSFRDIVIETNNEGVLVFTYDAMSDGKRKTFTAQKSAIVGWSTSEA